MKKLAVFAVAAMVAASAFAAGGWYLNGDNPSEYGMILGGQTYDCTAWSQDPSAPTSLGSLSDLTVTGLAFDIWGDNIWNKDNPNTGANYYFLIYDGAQIVEGTQKLGETDYTGDGLWGGHGTWVDGKDNHNWAISYSGSYDILSDSGMANVNLEEGKDYTLQVYGKTYGGENPDYISGNGQNYSATFKYSAVPEPATMSLLGLGALAMALRRKLRK